MTKQTTTNEDLELDVNVPRETTTALEILTTAEDLITPLSAMAQMVSNSTNLSAKQKVVSLIPEYYEFQAAGESVRGIFLDTFDVNYRDNGTGELIVKKAVRFIVDKKIYINSGYLLVEGILKSGIVSGTPIEITYTGKDKNAKKYSVELLD
jgi:hypothetical protein